MSRMILIKAREAKVGHQKIEFQHNKKGPWHSSIADVWSNSKKAGDLKVSHLMNRNHPDTGKPFTAEDLLGENSRHGIRFVDGVNTAVETAFPHHSLGGADEGTPSSVSSSEKTSTPDSGSAQAPDDPGQTKLTDFGLKTKMQKSHVLGLGAAWDFLLKALPQSFLAGASGIPEIRRAKMDELVAGGMAPAQAKKYVEAMFEGEMAAEYDRDAPYRGEGIPERDTVQQITPPVPARMKDDLDLQAAREEGEAARERLSPKARRTFEEQGQM